MREEGGIVFEERGYLLLEKTIVFGVTAFEMLGYYSLLQYFQKLSLVIICSNF